MGNIGAGVANIPVHLAHDANVLVAVEKRVLVLSLDSGAADAAMRRLVGFEAGIRKDDDESLGVLVGRRNRHVLLSHELRQRRRRQRLGPCHGGVGVRHLWLGMQVREW